MRIKADNVCVSVNQSATGGTAVDTEQRGTLEARPWLPGLTASQVPSAQKHCMIQNSRRNKSGKDLKKQLPTIFHRLICGSVWVKED